MKNPLQTTILSTLKKAAISLFAFLFAFMPYGFTAIESLSLSLQKQTAHAMSNGELYYQPVDAYNIRPGTFDGVVYQIGDSVPNALGTTYLHDMSYNEDGSRVYVLASDADDHYILRYDLSTPYDMSTAQYVGTVINLGSAGELRSMIFSNDGTRMYLTDWRGGSKKIRQYDLSTPYRPNTAVLDGILADDEIHRPRGLIFNEDGTKMYVLQTTTYAHINEFDLGIPYDILTATYNSRALNVNPQTGKYIQDIGYNYDGTKLFVMNSGGIYEYDLGDPYDIATAVYNSVALSFGQQVSSFMFDDTGNSLYTLMGPASWRVDERIFKYKLAEPSMFAETVSNDGSVEGDLSVIISQDTFNDPNNDGILDPSAYTLGNAPAGLVPVVNLYDRDGLTPNTTGTALVAILTFTGNATDHENIHDVSDITFVFDDSAFNSGDASMVTKSGDSGAYSTNVEVDFDDAIYGPGAVTTDITLWLNANAGVTLDTGNSLDSWADQSGNGHEFIDNDGNEGPDIVTGTASNFNFNNSLNFVQNDDRSLIDSSTVGLVGSTAATLFAVKRTPTGQITEHIFTAKDGSGETTDMKLSIVSMDDGSYGNYSATIGGVADGLVHIVGARDLVGGDGQQEGILDGVIENDTVLAVVPSNTLGNNVAKIGTDNSNGEFYSGDIAEMLVFQTNLSDTEVQRVNSYFALKYGMTLDTSIGDYLNSDGVSVYDLTAAAGAYQEHVIGIARDIKGWLDQRVSKSQSAGSILTIATDADFVSENGGARTMLGDNKYLVIASNGGATSTQTTEIASTHTNRVTREWRVENTGSVDEINLLFDGFDDNYYLLTDEDGDFSSGVSEVGQLTASGEVLDVALGDNKFFTIAERSDLALVEFSTDAASSTDESTADNLPVLLVKGTFAASQSIDIIELPLGDATEGAGNDFTFTSPTTITIPAGTYDGTLGTAISLSGLVLLDDNDMEGDEFISFAMESPSVGISEGDANDDAFVQDSFRYTITDDEVVTVRVEFAADSSDLENTGGNLPQILVLGIVTAPTTVQVTNAGTGSATEGAGNDYTFTSPVTVTIPADTYGGTLGSAISLDSLTILGDATVESDETINFVLSNPTGDAILEDADSSGGINTTHTYTITDDDTIIATPGVTIVPIDLLSDEGGDTASFVVVLDTEPTGDVYVDLVSSDTSEGTVATPLTFTPTNWNVPQTVIVTGQDDAPSDGTIVYTIQTDINDGLTADASYDALVDADIDDVTLQNQDDDAPAILVTIVDDRSGESGDTAEIQFELVSQPTGGHDITINLASSDTGEATVPASITILNADWNVPGNNSVTITGIDDALTDGNQNVTIVTTIGSAPAGSAYETLVDTDVADPIIINNDDETILTASITASDSSADENPSSNGQFEVYLDGPNNTGSAITVSYVLAVGGSNAINGTDYTLLPLTINIPIGATRAFIDVDPIDDGDVEGFETIDVTITGTNSASAVVGVMDNAVVTITDDEDQDGDGASNSLEDAGFNGGDGNGDGIADSTQQSVSGAANPVTGAYTTLKATGACTFITENAFLAESSLAVSDSTAEYPVGLVDFQVRCTDPGDSSDITLYYDQNYDTSTWSYKKYNSTGNVYSDLTSAVTFGTFTHTTGPETGTTVTTASFTVTDGDPRTDEDGVADGIINDPSGPAVVVATNSGSSSSGGASRTNTCKDETATNYSRFGTHKQSICEYTPGEEPVENTGDLISQIETLKNILADLQADSQGVDISAASCPHFNGFWSKGDQSDELTKWQIFLNKELSLQMNPTGYYGAQTDSAIRAFQAKYADKILSPWNLSAPTGNLYKTTRGYANFLFGCDEGVIDLDGTGTVSF